MNLVYLIIINGKCRLKRRKGKVLEINYKKLTTFIKKISINKNYIYNNIMF